MLTAREILKAKGFKIKEDHIEAVEMQWRGLQAAKSTIELDYLKESKIGLTNVPGGDAID